MDMKNIDLHQEVIAQTAAHVKALCEHDTTGHDWHHIERVWRMAKHLANTEQCNVFVVECAALLHDVEDWKISGSEDASEIHARAWLQQIGVDERDIEQIVACISTVTYKGAHVATTPTSTEAACVQDADRLDAIGAIGIGRAFAYGGAKNRSMHNGSTSVTLHDSFEQYQQARSTTIHHFYEKLLLLKDRMNTPEAKRIAAKRHEFLELFLHTFLREWDGVK